MLLDGIKLTNTGQIEKASIERAAQLPSADLFPGRLVFLTEVYEGNLPGLYVTGLDGKWTLAAGIQTSRSNFLGTLSVMTGTARMYPSANMRIVNISASAGTPATGSSILIDVKKNGASILNGSLLVLPAGSYRSDIMFNSTAVSTTDYLTVDIAQVGSTTPGSDLVVTVAYQ